MKHNRVMTIVKVHYMIMSQRNPLLCVTKEQQQKDVFFKLLNTVAPCEFVGTC